MKIVLASGSPRRQELLKLVVPNFEVMVSDVDEKMDEQLLPQEQVTLLAYKKAKAVFDKTKGDRIIIGSDTIVAKNNIIYGKPNNKEDAKRMIKELTNGNKTHSIFTGLCIIAELGGKYQEYRTFDEVIVNLKDIDDSEIEKWIETGKAMDKAGAYAVQEEFCVFIDKIKGNYHSAVGLPTHKVYDILKKIMRKSNLKGNE